MKPGVSEALARGLDHHRAGRIEAAIGEYAAALALDPDSVDALNLRGLAEHQRGDNATALRLLARAHALQPDFAGALQHLADVQRATGDLDAAKASYAKLAALAPGWHGGHYGLGTVLDARGERAAAAAAFEAAIAAKPDFAPALFALANLRALEGDAQAGLRHMMRAHAAAPTPETWHGLASMRLSTGDPRGAEADLRACLALAPDHPGGLTSLAQLLLAERRLDEADAVAARLTAAYPDGAEPLFVEGQRSQAHGLLSPAIRAYARAFLVYAGDPAGDLPTPVLLARVRAACAALERRIAGDGPPVHPQAGERISAAAASLGPLLLSFDDFATARAILGTATALAAGVGALQAWQNLIAVELYDPAATPESFAERHAGFARAMRARLAGPAPARPPRGPRAKLRIGYLSSDFRDHPAARCMAPLFEERDRARFEAWAYSLSDTRDATSERFARAADGWRDVARLPDAELAGAIRADGIDILVIYAGHFDRNRLSVALHAPAPIVVSLGDCATSGLAEIDYLFADSSLVPRGSREPFAERVLRLPCQYVNAPLDEAPPVAAARQAGEPVAFASFSNPAKLNGATLKLWAELLERVPGSTLALGHHRAFEDAELAARVLAPFVARGIDPARLIFRPPPRDATAHLAAYGAIDVALDPFPFNGSTTTYEALWMGVPVVALAGDTMVARWTTALLRRVGLDAFSAPDTNSYLRVAADLAADAPLRAKLRGELRGRLAASTICNPARWMRHVERAYQAIWRA